MESKLRREEVGRDEGDDERGGRGRKESDRRGDGEDGKTEDLRTS